jgi:phospholipid-binding lipoprotein MlaA
MMNHPPILAAPLLAAACIVVAAAGCATRAANPDDPLERYNRAIFGFNETVDEAVIRPVAKAYDKVTPLPVRTGVGNFYGNVGDLWTGINNLLQGKLAAGFSDASRVVVNTTVGIFGLFDIASELGISKNDEDFGQTLGRWGVGEGAFFVVPFFGPRTVRDAAVLPIDLYGDNVWGISDVPTRNTLTALRLVHTRANLLGIERTLEEGTLDKYAYARDFYLQQRRYKVFDGSPPNGYEDFDGADAGPLGNDVDGVAHAALVRLELVNVGATDRVRAAETLR